MAIVVARIRVVKLANARKYKNQKENKMTKLHKIALSVVAMVAVGMGFGGCGDDGKSPLMEMQSNPFVGTMITLQSRDDDTTIKKMTIKGRNGKCNEKDLIPDMGVGFSLAVALPSIKYGEKIPYNAKRVIVFSDDKCPPKNGKYEIEMDTNFGTYYYEIGQ